MIQPLDLTTLAPADPDADTDSDTLLEDDDAAAGLDADAGAGGSQIVVSTGLRVKNPSSVRIASLGIERPAVDGIDRLMWGSTDAGRAMALFGRLPDNVASPVLNRRLEHLMLTRAVPPGGTVDNAEALVAFRLDWLRTRARAEDLAAMVRQLPDQDPWLGWKQWLVLHDLINRNDETACLYARDRVAVTLESVWHQINAFCQVVGGEIAQASFGLDILADSGVEDPAFFALMEQLTGGREARLPEDAEIGPVNLVLMDSARVEISSAALQSVEEHRTSLAGLRYLGDDAQILLGARLFSRPDLPVGEVVAEWAVLPVANVPASEALTQLSVAGGGDETDLARFLAWQAIALEGNAANASDLAMRALSIDHAYAGGRSLELWAPFIVGGDAALLNALLPGANASAASGEAASWAVIMADATGTIDAAHLAAAGAIDAIPLLQAMGRPVGIFDWHAQVAEQRALAPGGAGIRFGNLLALESSALSGNKAETLLMAAVALGPEKPWRLGRDDAARLVAALRRAGLEETARELGREILAGWVLERHFTEAGNTDADAG